MRIDTQNQQKTFHPKWVRGSIVNSRAHLTCPSHAHFLNKKQLLDHKFQELLLELVSFSELLFGFVSIADSSRRRLWMCFCQILDFQKVILKDRLVQLKHDCLGLKVFSLFA